MLDGKSREMGLGSIRMETLSQAREKANHCKNLLRSGCRKLQNVATYFVSGYQCPMTGHYPTFLKNVLGRLKSETVAV